ncbi:hypothetical protein CAC42_1112 [Sphaceloma murrayae]|uniref:AB hydrolase-1 domain-containing protein n=1 Tax=Sphaceloma murrayae TaxID=2082308 RepID=A0A2K1R2C7_9PEZI|nr:hypothetical protein CAC42_1112 [Sphaceloma murrayae]
MPLSFRRSSAPPTPLPAGVTRSFIPTAQGPLELLSAVPASSSNSTPLFFQHGGFGNAAVWLEFMTFLSAAPYNIPCYAISLRGHGASWKPGYLHMTFGTTRNMMVEDLVTGIKHVEGLLGAPSDKSARVILVAHSSGGGLAQSALNDGKIKVRGLALLDAAPPSGLAGVYWNWFKADRWFPVRVYWHLMHSRSPLSTTALVKNVFFCDQFPLAKVSDFESLMPPFESLVWPSSIMGRFASVGNILRNITVSLDRSAVLIMAAEKSRLMGVPMMRNMAVEYTIGVGEALTQQDKEVASDRLADVVSFEVVKGAGHHLQNDLNWQEGADKLAKFYGGNTA